MNERQRTAKARLRLIVAEAPPDETPTAQQDQSALPALRDVPRLSLRVGRHLAAWVLWHTSRVSLLDDAPPAEFERAARA